jgi:hypothetical protein
MNLKARVSGLVKRRQQRRGGPWEGEIFIRYGLPFSGSIARATLCNVQAERWTDIERADNEGESAFVLRVRTTRNAHGGYIVWNPLPEPLSLLNDTV